MSYATQRRECAADERISRRLREQRDLLLIRRAASLLAAELSLGELFERLCEIIAEYIDASVVFIALLQPDGRIIVEYVHDHGEIRQQPNIVVPSHSRTAEVIRTNRIIWGNRVEDWVGSGERVPLNADRPHTDDSVSAMFVPVRVGGEVVGALSVQSSESDAYDESEVELIAAIARYLAVAVKNQRLVGKLQRVADIDPLTGLFSHSRMLREVDRLTVLGSSSRPVTALLINITNFAMFNATFGYASGDDVLREVGRMLTSHGGDATVGRYGGDVFLVLLPPTPKDQALAFVERLAQHARALAFRDGNATIPISLAMGFAFAPIDAQERGEVLALCRHRCSLSRKQGGRPVGEDDIDAYQLHGIFPGIETIVEGLLDRDPYTRVHLFHCNAMAKHWAEYNLELDRTQLNRFLQAALLHDVGKLLVSDRILVKPTRLTPEEYFAIQRHAEFGQNILGNYPAFEDVARIVGQHHERWDGLGYPAGLRAEQIDPLARAIAILDAFSAMVMDRPYHRGIDEQEAVREIERCSGTQFDPFYAQRFVEWRRSAWSGGALARLA